MNKINAFMSATSFPRSTQDWQGVFIRNISNALADHASVDLKLWAPDGPRHDAINYVCTPEEQLWLNYLMEQGGIAHLLKNNKLNGAIQAAKLLYVLRKSYLRYQQSTDIYHVNWLQNALPLVGNSIPLLVSVLGTDFQLLKKAGMVTALRKVFSNRNVVITPNAQWMESSLIHHFGDLATVQTVPFGIDDRWYNVERQPKADRSVWIAVIRVTKAKIGPLFEWGESIFADSNKELHLIGPNQENLEIPEWVHFHGSASPSELVNDWFPIASGMITLSQHSEGRPQVMLEAMASGLPIIASNLPAHADFIDDYQTGRLVDSKETFVEALDWMLDHNNQQYCAHNCKKLAYDEYGTWRDCAERYLYLYRAIAE